MVIIILEDSTEAIRQLVELFITQKPNDKLHIFACPGVSFIQSDYTKLKKQYKNETDILFFRYKSIKQIVEAICQTAAEHANNTRLVVDLSMFYDLDLQYKDFKSISIVRQAIAKKAISTEQVYFYSYRLDFEIFSDQLPEFKDSICRRPEDLTGSDGSKFFAIIAGR